jgi:hypothetical protein
VSLHPPANEHEISEETPVAVMALVRVAVPRAKSMKLVSWNISVGTLAVAEMGTPFAKEATREDADVKVADVELTPPKLATAVQVPAVGKLVPENVIAEPVEVTPVKAGLDESVEYMQFVGSTQPIIAEPYLILIVSETVPATEMQVAIP